MDNAVSNESLIQIAGQFGTPVYVYHAETIRNRYNELKNAFGGIDARIFYACKALTNINVLKYVKNIGCNVDCSSVNEVLLARRAGFEPENILYTSNNIAFPEIERACDEGVNINIDSLSNLEKFANKYGNTYPVGIRLRPNIMAGGNLKISTGHERSKFGIPLEHLFRVQEIVKATGVKITALHIHTGSEIKDVEVFAKGIEVLFEVAQEFPDLVALDLGGGFKVPYIKGEEGTDIPALGIKVREEFARHQKATGRKLQVWFEPGKFLVSEAGTFITRVNVLKDSVSINFAGVDTGLNHLIRPMFYGSWHEIENISNPSGPMNLYNVVGNICETDTFAEDRPLHEVREGDLLVFRNAGAYGFEMSSNYNSRYRPAEVLVENGQPRLIRRREEFEDLLKTQIID